MPCASLWSYDEILDLFTVWGGEFVQLHLNSNHCNAQVTIQILQVTIQTKGEQVQLGFKLVLNKAKELWLIIRLQRAVMET